MIVLRERTLGSLWVVPSMGARGARKVLINKRKSKHIREIRNDGVSSSSLLSGTSTFSRKIRSLLLKLRPH